MRRNEMSRKSHMMLSGVQPHGEPKSNEFTVLGLYSYVDSRNLFNEISIWMFLEGVTISHSTDQREKETLV